MASVGFENPTVQLAFEKLATMWSSWGIKLKCVSRSKKLLLVKSEKKKV